MDRGWFLGILGGAITALSGLLGYVVVPVVTEQNTVSLLAIQPYYQFVSSPFTYHAIVLVLPSFFMTLFGVLQARHWGLTSKLTDLKVVSGILGLPLLTAGMTYILYLAEYLAVEILPVPESATIGDIAAVAFILLWAVIFGFIFLVIVLVGIAGAVGIGSLCGYLVAKGITRIGWSAK